MAKHALENSSAPDRHAPLSRKEISYSIRRGTESPKGSTEQSSAIPAAGRRVSKESRHTGRK